MQGGGSIRRDMTERFNGACAGAPCLTENPGRKFFLADAGEIINLRVIVEARF